MLRISLADILQLHQKKKWNSHTLQENLARCYDKNLYVDAELKVQDRIFQAHRSILCFHSSVLKKKFYGTESPATMCTIEEIKPEVFEILLRCLYTSQVSDEVDPDNLMESCLATKVLQMVKIEEKLIHHILYDPRPDLELHEKTIAEAQFWSLLKKCRSEGYESFQEKLLKFAESNFKTVFDSEGFVEADIKTIKLLLDRKFPSVPQADVMESIARWVEANDNLVSLDQHIRELLNRVDFKRLSPKEFHAVASRHDRLLSKKDSLDILMHLVDPTVCPLPEWYQFEEKGWNTLVDKETDSKTVDGDCYPTDGPVLGWDEAKDWGILVNEEETDSKTLDEVWNNPSLPASNWRKKDFKLEEDFWETSSLKYLEMQNVSEEISCQKILQESFCQMLEEGSFTDVTLIAKDNTQIPAHRLVLALGSEFFADVFYEAAPSSNTFHMEETAEDVKDMLRYFYENGKTSIDELSLDSILRKSDMALKYLCYPLMQICNNALFWITLNPGNFWTLTDWMVRVSHIKWNIEVLLNFVAISTKQVFENHSFLKASKDSLVTVLKSDYLHMAEGDILEYVARWMEENTKELPTESSRKELLENIRFEALAARQFFAFLKKHEGILPIKDSSEILKCLLRRREDYCLPVWCYRGPLRNAFYNPSAKIGTNVPVVWSGSSEKGNNSFSCSYTVSIRDKQPKSEIQFLELSLKMKPQCSSYCTCSVTIKTKDGSGPLTFQHLYMSCRYLVPVCFRLDASRKPRIEFILTVDTTHYHKVYPVTLQALEFDNAVFMATSGKNNNFLCDAIVDGFTSENVPIPPHLLSKRNVPVRTELFFKSHVKVAGSALNR